VAEQLAKMTSNTQKHATVYHVYINQPVGPKSSKKPLETAQAEFLQDDAC